MVGDVVGELVGPSEGAIVGLLEGLFEGVFDVGFVDGERVGLRVGDDVGAHVALHVYGQRRVLCSRLTLHKMMASSFHFGLPGEYSTPSEYNKTRLLIDCSQSASSVSLEITQGVGVGFEVGAIVDWVGPLVGMEEGAGKGAAEGVAEGAADGSEVGVGVGDALGAIRSQYLQVPGHNCRFVKFTLDPRCDSGFLSQSPCLRDLQYISANPVTLFSGDLRYKLSL